MSFVGAKTPLPASASHSHVLSGGPCDFRIVRVGPHAAISVDILLSEERASAQVSA